jgi:TolB-like protein/ankyrin repeat protein/class 3 adenylate cyclase
MAKDRLSGTLAVILHADVAGSTELVHQNEQLAHQRIQDTFHRFGDTISKYHGHVRELRGDALLAEFERASDAVTAALAFQAGQTDYNAQLNDDIQPTVRVGIAMGEVIIADDTITGTGVVLAQRLEQLSKPGGLVIQGAAYETIPGRFPFEYEDLGRHEVKGFEQPVRVYSASLKSDTDIPQPGPIGHGNRNTIVAIAAVAFIVAGIALMWFKPWEVREKPAMEERMAFALPDKPSIAVLPFTNMSGDPEQEYFADGMTEDLITDLSKIAGLFVIARNSTFTYKGKSVKVGQVAEELGVRYVLEGSVRRAGDQVRINAQLIDATTGGHLWADRYDGSMSDVFSLQDNITRQIVSALESNLAPGETAASSKTVSTRAYDAFLKGWAYYQRHTLDDLTKARPYLEQAIQLDDDYAQAHAALAAIYWEIWSNGWAEHFNISMSEAMGKAKQHVKLGLKEAAPLAHWVASNIEISEGNYQKAVSEAEQVVALNSNNPAGYATLAKALDLSGKSDESAELIDKAVRLDPYYSPLHTAAKIGDTAKVKQLIVDGISIATKDYYGKTTLHVATETGNEKIAALLIDAGADIEARTRRSNRDFVDYGSTPLLLAAHWGQTGVAELLIRSGADVNALYGPYDPWSALHYAIFQGQEAVAELLIANGADVNLATDLTLETPLHAASRGGHESTAELLISNGANVNAANKNAATPLSFAALSGEYQIVRLLLANGAEVNMKAARGNVAVETPLHATAYSGHTQIAELLLASGADIDATDQYGYTPLRRAVDKGQLAMAELLIKKGADITTRDKYGITPLHIVARTDHIAIAELLIDRGADVNARDSNSDFTPLDYAQDGEPKMIELLENHGSVCTSC